LIEVREGSALAQVELASDLGIERGARPAVFNGLGGVPFTRRRIRDLLNP